MVMLFESIDKEPKYKVNKGGRGSVEIPDGVPPIEVCPLFVMIRVELETTTLPVTLTTVETVRVVEATDMFNVWRGTEMLVSAREFELSKSNGEREVKLRVLKVIVRVELLTQTPLIHSKEEGSILGSKAGQVIDGEARGLLGVLCEGGSVELGKVGTDTGLGEDLVSIKGISGVRMT